MPAAVALRWMSTNGGRTKTAQDDVFDTRERHDERSARICAFEVAAQLVDESHDTQRRGGMRTGARDVLRRRS